MIEKPRTVSSYRKEKASFPHRNKTGLAIKGIRKGLVRSWKLNPICFSRADLNDYS